MRFAPVLLAAVVSSALTACDHSESTSTLSPQATLASGSSGFLTKQPAQARALLPQAEVKPIITSGDPLPGVDPSEGEYALWAGIPDGLGAYRDGESLILHSNHEMGLDDNNGASELYLYVAASPADVLAGKGKLYVFTTDEATHSGNLATGQTIKGAFQEITTWDHTKSAADLQDAVDNIGSHGALPFVRIEDADYDHRAGVANQKPAIYFVDTGNGATTGRVAGKVNVTCNGLCDHFGSIYRVQFDPAEPTRATLTLLARSRGVAAGDWASPDNVAAGKTSLMVQEDPAYPEFNRPERIWNFQFKGDGTLGEPQAVVELTTEQQTGKVCSDAALTCWESSGIIDASEWLGAGTWLFDVQAHTLPILKVQSDGSYELGADGQPLKLTNNESGQLLYLRVPGT